MKIRAFIAVDISDEARRATAGYIESLRNEFREVRAGWERAEKLHLTLKFLGDTDAKQLDELKKIVTKVAGETSKFSLKLNKNGVFPNPRNARVVWIGVEDAGENLRRINQILENECEKIGFQSERRNYHPHLTIARLKEPKNATNLVAKHLAAKPEPLAFEVSEIVIYESKLQPSGSIYKKIFSAKLTD